jgi:hypothetical protein
VKSRPSRCPHAKKRRGFLAFEATEGGAGVLGRLTSDPVAMARVAATALELMHYRSIGPAVTAADPDLLQEVEDAHCVKGCYRCLLSYYNQPDHELIDRTDKEVRLLLLRLARSSVKKAPRPTASAATTTARAQPAKSGRHLAPRAA